MLLKQLLKNLDYTLVQGCLNTEVTDIYYDSRKVTPGGLFVCIVGTQRDSHDYAADVAAKGAAVLAIQHDLPAEVLAALPDVTVVKFENTRYAMALLSTAYFGRPALEMTMVGVTGTKGKTHHHPHDQGCAGSRRSQGRHGRHQRRVLPRPPL